MRAVTFKVSDDEFRELKKLADTRNLTVSMAVRQSLFRSNLADELIAKTVQKVDETRQQIGAQIAEFRDSVEAINEPKSQQPVATQTDQNRTIEAVAAVIETLVLFASDQSQKARINAVAAAILSGQTVPLSNRKRV